MLYFQAKMHQIRFR